MAVALTDFKALCGFMPIARIAEYITAVPEFNSLIDPSIVTGFLNCTDLSVSEQKAALKKLFAALMTADVSNIATQLRTLIARYQRGGQKSVEEDVKDLVLTLNGQYPGDVGVFCAFMLNYVRMTPGQAIFLGAGEPHAYVEGGMSSPVGIKLALIMVWKILWSAWPIRTMSFAQVLPLSPRTFLILFRF
jgi:mannose-6-phosphate isomerase